MFQHEFQEERLDLLAAVDGIDDLEYRQDAKLVLRLKCEFGLVRGQRIEHGVDLGSS